jgi:hypothetical protein
MLFSDIVIRHVRHHALLLTSPAVASAVLVQPFRSFKPDALILFSDILTWHNRNIAMLLTPSAVISPFDTCIFAAFPQLQARCCYPVQRHPDLAQSQHSHATDTFCCDLSS